MELICTILLFVLLGISFYQDWKFRAISWLVFPLLLITCFVLFTYTELGLESILMNLCFLSIVMSTLILYVSVKRRRLTNIFNSDFGAGDVLFLLAITPLFIDQNYILFFISGMLFSIVIHYIIQRFDSNPRIPLAGYLALYLSGLKAIDLYLDNDLFNTSIL